MNYIITGGTGFIGTHLTNLIKERYPDAQVYNLDIVKPGTPNPVVKDYKPALREGQKMASTFVEYDIRKLIENLPFTPTEDDVIFNFATVHRTLDMKIMSISRQISVEQRMLWLLPKSGISRRLCLLLVLHHTVLLRNRRRRLLYQLLILRK